MADGDLRTEPAPPRRVSTARPAAPGYRPMPPGGGRFSDRYSVFVGWMKWLLPGAAIMLVGLVMMWPQLERTGSAVERSVMSEVKPEDFANIQLVNPRYMGEDDLNRPYMLTADVARQATPEDDQVHLEGPKADITLEDGTWLALTADQGVFFQKAKELNLEGTVNIFHDKGYSVETGEAMVDLEAGTAHGNKPVVAHGPMGTLQSEGFRVYGKGETVIFTGKSRLVLYPDEEGGVSLPTPGDGQAGE